jgi:hypothetical protein
MEITECTGLHGITRQNTGLSINKLVFINLEFFGNMNQKCNEYNLLGCNATLSRALAFFSFDSENGGSKFLHDITFPEDGTLLGQCYTSSPVPVCAG